jgi:hypothetical protein
MFYYLYQITNIVNNKIYVGVHKTMDMNDGYMGSGKIIIRAIKKHGIDNFKKDILETFVDSESMYVREKEIVTDEFLLREDAYNLRRGGLGGFDYINANPSLYLTEKRLSTLMSNEERLTRWKTLYESDNNFRIKIKHNAKLGNAAALKAYPNGAFFGRKHSNDTILKMKKSHAGKQSGSDNSQYGSMWITNGLDSKKINKNDTIPDSWYKGRKIK